MNGEAVGQQSGMACKREERKEIMREQCALVQSESFSRCFSVPGLTLARCMCDSNCFHFVEFALVNTFC